MHFSYEPRACTCLLHLPHSPLSPTLFVILTLAPCFEFCNVAPYFCTLSSAFASSNMLCALRPLCFFATPTFGDPPFLATHTLGDACRHFESLSFISLPLDLTPQVGKDKNRGKVFLELLFFYLGDLVKKPPRGKKSVPYDKIVTWLFTYIIQLK